MKKLILVISLIIFSFNTNAQYSITTFEDYQMLYVNTLSVSEKTLHFNDSINFTLFEYNDKYDEAYTKFEKTYPNYMMLNIDSNYGLFAFLFTPNLLNPNLEIETAKIQIAKLKKEIESKNKLDILVIDDLYLLIFNKTTILSNIEDMNIDDVDITNINELLLNFF